MAMFFSGAQSFMGLNSAAYIQMPTAMVGAQKYLWYPHIVT